METKAVFVVALALGREAPLCFVGGLLGGGGEEMGRVNTCWRGKVAECWFGGLEMEKVRGKDGESLVVVMFFERRCQMREQQSRSRKRDWRVDVTAGGETSVQW